MAYSILIKNGTIMDGAGKEPYVADVGITEGRITKIGDLSKESAPEVIDATNLYVTPGFIDLTSHADTYGTLFRMPFQESLLMQGVTTILLGNCGESLAPMIGAKSSFDLEKWTSDSSVSLNWARVSEYYANIAKRGVGVNVATLVGENTIKNSAKKKEERVFLLEESLKDGAWGISSNFNFVDWTKALEEETLYFLEIVKKFNGLYKIHLRDEGKDFLPSVASLIALTRASGARTIISHFKAVGRGAWHDFADALHMIKTARSEGIDVTFDLFPYLRTGSMLVSLLPLWSRVGGDEEILKRLKSPDLASKIAMDLAKITLHAEKILIASAPHNKSIVGQTLAEVSAKFSLSPEATIIELLKINELKITIFGKTLNAKNLLASASFSDSIVSSDGAGYNLEHMLSGELVHPRSFGAFPRFFKVIAEKSGTTRWKAIEKMTSLPARMLGLSDRGVLAVNAIADIAIFNPGEFRDRATYKNPYRYATGLKFLLINGKLSVKAGIVQSERNGVVLKKNV